jgi:hypothetical protein
MNSRAPALAGGGSGDGDRRRLRGPRPRRDRAEKSGLAERTARLLAEPRRAREDPSNGIGGSREGQDGDLHRRRVRGDTEMRCKVLVVSYDEETGASIAKTGGPGPGGDPDRGQRQRRRGSEGSKCDRGRRHLQHAREYRDARRERRPNAGRGCPADRTGVRDLGAVLHRMIFPLPISEVAVVRPRQPADRRFRLGHLTAAGDARPTRAAALVGPQ